MIKINGVSSNRQYMGSNLIFNYKKGYDYSIPFYMENITQSTEEVLIRVPKTENLTYFDIDKSTDGATWTTMQGTDIGEWYQWLIYLSPNDKVYMRASTPTWTDSNNSDVHAFITGMSKIGGNILSLIYGGNFTGQERELPTGSRGNFQGLFSDSGGSYHLVDASKLILPVQHLTHMCYRQLFSGCSNLINSPVVIDAIGVLGEYGFSETFSYCTSLVTPPVYNKNFDLSGAGYTFHVGFDGCTALVTAPVLPMTSLGQGCYNNMFQNCSSLVNAPVLPATTLASWCYNGMFNGCTSLETAPALPAAALAEGSYRYMFYGCSSLENITCLATDISASQCTEDWVNGVAASGTFTKNANMSSWGSGDSGIPSGWTVQDA